MEKIVEFLEAIGPVGRDRVLTAQSWCNRVYASEGGPRCMVGHGCDLQFNTSELWEAAFAAEYGRDWKVAELAAWAFDDMVRERGLGYTVALVKAECARLNASDAKTIEEMTAQSVEVGRG